MNNKFTITFEDVFATNKNGEIRNLLITDGNTEFLDEALYSLRSWSVKNSMNLVEIDERDDSWLSEIQSRELFYKLNQPNTVLLIKNYSTVNFHSVDENTPRNFLRDVVINRHYGCGNDFEPSDDLRNLVFVVALNDLSQMRWRKDEYALFAVIHEDDEKMLWTNTSYCRSDSKMNPVMSAVNKVNYFVSEDRSALCFDVGIAFGEQSPRRPIRFRTANERTEIIHTYLEKHLPDFSDQVDCLILKAEAYSEKERFVIDCTRLKNLYPKLDVIYCTNSFEISNVNDEIYILDPFDIGELCFFLAQDGDIELANICVHELWALDHKWARFFREVAKDYYRKPEDHQKVDPNSTVYKPTGMDHLFHIYLLGWYHAGDDFGNEEDKVYVSAHKDFDKAIDLLPIRFQNCSIDEIAYKLYWDHMYVKRDEKPDYEQLVAVFEEAEGLVPGTVAKMRENGWLNDVI